MKGRGYSDNLVREVSVLSQRLKGKIPHVEDYGLTGSHARTISKIHYALDHFELTEAQRELLKMRLEYEIQIGFAEKLSMGSDILTQLGATIGKVGKTINL